MIESLLIANRGEIARRIIRTARRLGIRTIAVYSDADAGSPHVKEADAAVAIGPAPARESYLVGEKLIAAARSTGAQAIHPGYGFLSENADFADAVKTSGLVWVGPPAAAIRAIGLKDAAKALMTKAGVPVTPGYFGTDQSLKKLRREADAIGYPVLIKAVAGGGGKGMRRVDEAGEFAEALASCQREAAAAFADDRVLIEKYLSRPRHIEVQVFADQHGNVVHLFERDCSLQRRHQKVVEEAPAPGIDDQTRNAICGAAVNAAKAINYEGAGTIEFIADASEGLRADRIYFMEMNTRLQVEHPVTEAITGQDLVEWQLRVASGEPLPLRQQDLKISGHAVEARLYAENPQAGFLPSTGQLKRFRLPAGLRVDSGFQEGDDVSPYYDPMLAKVVAHGPTRQAAANRLAKACAEIEVWPVKTNASFLAQALSDEAFLKGDIDTSFIPKRLDKLLTPVGADEEVLQTAAAARVQSPGADPWSGALGFRVNRIPRIEVEIQEGDVRHLIVVDQHATTLPAISDRDTVVVFKRGNAYAFSPPRHDIIMGLEKGGSSITAPMPGRVIAVFVKEGDTVVQGQTILKLEAMKMEHALTAVLSGKVQTIAASVGELVVEGAVLASLAPEQ